MQKSYLYLLVIIINLFLVSCDSKSSETAETVVKDKYGYKIPDTVYSENYGYALNLQDKNCLADSQNIICEFGVSQIAVLGFPLDELKFEDNIEVKDTLFSQGDYQWKGKEVLFSDRSKIILEGNFVDEGDPGNQLPQSYVNRIRVESSLFQTDHGIKVGQTFGKFKGLLPKVKIVAIYIPSVNMVDLTIPEMSGLHFNLPLDVEVDLQDGYQGKEIPTSLIPDQTLIHSIVVAF